MLTVGRQVTLDMIDLDYKGQGVSKMDGYVIFTPGVLIGEKAIVEITKINKNFAEANLIELLTISKKRAHDSSLLGSIELYHLEVNEQIKWQEKITKETFLKVAQIEVDLEETITDSRFTNYRNKSVFHVIDGPVIKLGLYLKNYLLTETQQFILSDKTTNKFLNLINRLYIPIEQNVISHIIFRTNEAQQILITLVATKEDIKGLDLFIKRLKAEPEVVGITLNLKDQSKNILGQQSIVLYGKNQIMEKLNQFELPINDRSFFQINFPVMKKVFETIKTHLIKDSNVVEAYSGIGTIGLSLIDQIKNCVMIESNKESMDMAFQIIQTYDLHHIKLVEDRAELVIDRYPGDVLIVDPPRQGLMKTLIDKVLEMNFKQIIYVSCDVKTLARDVKLLSDLYEIKYIYPIRMFHHTISIETCVILEKKSLSLN